MERNFSFKEAKQCYKSYIALIYELDWATNFLIKKSKEIYEAFGYINKDGLFSKIANAEILEKHFDFNDAFFDQLLINMRQFLSSKQTVANIPKIKNEIIKNIKNDLNSLDRISNPLSWTFSTKKTKDEGIFAYENLKNYFNNPIFKEANNSINYLRSLDDVSPKEAEEDFATNRSKYEFLIHQIISNKDRNEILPCNKEVLNKYSLIQNARSNFELIIEENKNEIKKALEKIVMEEVSNLLKDIPAEEIAKSKKGLRIKPLIDAGYTSVFNLYAANVYNLASVHGISQDNARTIKRIVADYVEKTRSSIKIKFSIDDKTKNTTDAINAIYIYVDKKKTINDVNELDNKYKNKIEKDIKNLIDVGNGKFWIFYNDQYKNEIKESYKEANDILDGEYFTIIRKLNNGTKEFKKGVDSIEAWNYFSKNSIEFYNVIEEIWPGLLGNSDILYGLPEDLAREVQEECFFPDGLLCTLRRYQELGVKYILHQERVLLGDEMGLGKTIEAIASMVSLKNTGATHFVVVCPASVLLNWCREIRRHSKLEPIKVHGSSKKAALKMRIKNGGVAVTTYETTSIFELDPMFRFSELVVDEAHYIKNMGAQRTRNAIQLSKYAERIVFMTGTPLENNVREMISLINVLNPKVASSVSGIAFMSTAKAFREKIAPVYYRRKREDVLTELPEKIESIERCEMGPEEEKAYERAVLEKKIMQARRVSWNIDDLSKSSKMNRLKEIVEEAKNDNRKILVFSFFLDTINKVVDALGMDACLNPINGSVNVNRRQEIIDEFNNAPAGTVLCAQILTGGTGLNIQSASVVIFCEPQLKPSTENQAISRVYRMGQSRKVQVFRLLCENTIDERILNILETKQKEFDAFADKSVAAEKVEVDEASLGNIINEEIERINNKNKNIKPKIVDIKPVSLWEKAKETYKGLPKPVTQRINEIPQPRGGYINPRNMEVINLPIKEKINANESVAPSLIGITVDYLTRFMIEKDTMKAFHISLLGSENVNEYKKALSMVRTIKGLDDNSIKNAIKLTGYDVAYRASPLYYQSVDNFYIDKSTIENVRNMVSRSIDFFEKFGPVIKFEFTFEGGYTKVIGSGDGDFMTNDTLWDMKVLKKEIENKHTYQLLVYYLMGLHSKDPRYKNIKYLGIFNPRLNKVYRYKVANISPETKLRIEEEVIGY